LPVTAPNYISLNYPTLTIGSTSANTINVPMVTLQY